MQSVIEANLKHTLRAVRGRSIVFVGMSLASIVSGTWQRGTVVHVLPCGSKSIP